MQTVPISFNGWGIRESVFILYFGQVGLRRDSALAFSLVGAGLIVLLSLSGAVVWTSRRRHRDRRRPTPPGADDGRSAVLHVCDKFGVAGSSIHGVSRLFSWWFPRYDPARFDGVAGAASSARSRPRGCCSEQGIPVHHLGRGRFDPRILTDLVRAGPRARRAHPPRARLRRRRLRAPGRARRVGAALVLHEHFADPRMPAYQGVADRAAGRAHRPRDRGERLDARLPGARALRARRARARSSGTARRSTSSRPCSRRSRGPRGAALGLPDDALVVGTIGRLNEQKGHRYLIEAAAAVLAAQPRARLLIVGRRRPDGRPAGAGGARWASPRAWSSPAIARTCPRCSARSTFGSQGRNASAFSVVLIFTWRWKSSPTSLRTARTVSSRRRARFSSEPPYSSLRSLMAEREELREEIAVGRVQLDPVEPGLAGAPGAGRECRGDLAELRRAWRARPRSRAAGRTCSSS